MVSLISFLVIFVVLQAGTLLFLWLGAHWVKSPRATWRRALLALGLFIGLGIVGSGLSFGLPERGPALTQLIGAALLLALQLGGMWVILNRTFATTGSKTWALWLLVVGWTGVQIALAIVVIRPYVLHAFVVPTNSMAPTVAGWHREGVCAKCAGRAIVPVMPMDVSNEADRDAQGICTQCRHVSKPRNLQRAVLGPDRIVVSKMRTAHRWDVVAYHPAQMPQEVYLQRLVGLPGETLWIDEGSVWVNGAKLELPPKLAGLTYASYESRADFATRSKHTQLGPDEYFLLGDFSAIALDSRFSGPIKRNAIVGVADLGYWPPGRMRLIR